MNRLAPESFDLGDRKGVYLLPRFELYGGYGYAIAFSVVEGTRAEAVLAHEVGAADPERPAEALVGPVYLGDAYASSDPHFATKVLHEFVVICCEQHELFAG